MAFITYPLNMVDYTAEDAELFHCTRSSGIYASNDFECIASGVDNTITVGEGIGWIRNSKYSGKVFANKTAEVIDLGLADASLPRYDVIAIQFNKAQNLTKIVVKNGTPASSPAIPERSVTESIYELYLCKVYRPVGALTITADNVTDTRFDANLCGLMADSVTSIDTSAINAQVEALIINLEAEIETVKDTSGLMFESEWIENGVIPVSKSGTGAVTAEEALANLGGISIVKLWGNASPTSSFASQTLDDELADAPSNYDYYINGFRLDTTKSDIYYQIVSKADSDDTQLWGIKDMRSSYEPLFVTRPMSVRGDKIWFSSGSYKPFSQPTASFERNTDVIPVFIFGVKGVL